ncbi:hypothetical protein AGMMS49928_21910 [Spirochaetia bacterium]|nr:hypothetical protein AGMMS49928_21910 [Spirochaetia bacterium]
MKRQKKQYAAIFIFGLVISAMNMSCAGAPHGRSQFEKFSLSFLEETRKAGEEITNLNNLVTGLSDYENRVGTLSDAEYKNVEKIKTEIPNVKSKIEMQIEKAKVTSRSVTPDGYYSDTKKEVKGWDAASYSNLRIETTLKELDQNYANSTSGYKNVNLQLLEKPDKPFNANTQTLLTEVKIDIASAKADISVKDWNSAKTNVDLANAALKRAIQLDLNTIEQYQAGLLQNDLKDVSNQISLGSALNTAGSILKTVGEGAANIWGGVGKIINGIGDNMKKED